MSIYVLIVRAMSERFVAAELIEAGYAAFSPIITRWERTEHGRRIKTHRPMLPRYVFAETADIDRDFDGLRHARRVSGILGNQRGPRALPAEGADWVHGLAWTQGMGGFDYTARSKPKMTINQQVRIVAGQFKGYVGKLVAITDSKATVYVEGKALRGNVPVKPDQIGDAEDDEGERRAA